MKFDLPEATPPMKPSIDALVAAAEKQITGELAKTLKLRLAGPSAKDAAGWTKVQQGAANGGKSKRKLSDAARTKAKQQRDELIERHGHTKKDACTIVGSELGVSYKTIERLK